MNMKTTFILLISMMTLLAACNLAENLDSETDSVLPVPTFEILDDSSEAEESILLALESEESDETLALFPDAPQTACDHPYLPLRAGATWHFVDEANRTTIEWTVTEVNGNEGDADATMNVRVDVPTSVQPIFFNYYWRCSAAQGLTSFEYVAMGTSTGDGNFSMTMNKYDGDGVLFPPADSMVPGATWGLTVLGNFTMLIGADLEADGTMSIQETDRVINADLVDFDGMLYEGLLIERNIFVTSEINMSGLVVQLEEEDLAMRSLLTLARGIGPIGWTTHVEGIDESSYKLLTFSIP
jgi:hypothetical protein